MPRSAEDYMVIFSGATADTEAVYSLGIDVYPDANFSDFTDTANYEPNNTEAQATPIHMQNQIMSYLHKNDVDFYKIKLGTTVPRIADLGVSSVCWGAGNSTAAVGNKF